MTLFTSFRVALLLRRLFVERRFAVSSVGHFGCTVCGSGNGRDSGGVLWVGDG